MPISFWAEISYDGNVYNTLPLSFWKFAGNLGVNLLVAADCYQELGGFG